MIKNICSYLIHKGITKELNTELKDFINSIKSENRTISLLEKNNKIPEEISYHIKKEFIPNLWYLQQVKYWNNWEREKNDDITFFIKKDISKNLKYLLFGSVLPFILIRVLKNLDNTLPSDPQIINNKVRLVLLLVIFNSLMIDFTLFNLPNYFAL